jgi:CheY-like chemotaxis protein
VKLALAKDVSMAPIGPGGRRNLLLVDNCLEQRDVYERALQQEFEILTATRGPEGVTLAEKVRPDAIILDADMAGWEGWETCTELKSNAITADIPVILLTGTTEPDLSQHASAVGASAILRKPCRADTLRASVFAVLGG